VCLLSPLLGQVAIFSSAFAFRELHFEAQMAAWLGMVASGARILASPIAGWVTDRQGARPALIGWSALGVSGFALLAAMPVAGTVFVVAGLAAVAGSGFSGAMNALTCGLPAAEHRAGHFTVLGFGMVITNAAAPPLIGKLLDSVPFAFGCGILAVLGALVVAGAWWVTRGLSARASDYR
jgi:MFS family permease